MSNVCCGQKQAITGVPKSASKPTSFWGSVPGPAGELTKFSQTLSWRTGGHYPLHKNPTPAVSLSGLGLRLSWCCLRASPRHGYCIGYQFIQCYCRSTQSNCGQALTTRSSSPSMYMCRLSYCSFRPVHHGTSSNAI